MTRIRTIKPEILEDDNTAGLSDAAFRLFAGLIVLSDDHGNIRAHENLLQTRIWWARKNKPEIRELLAELHSSLLIEVYEVRSQIYAHLRGWEKHQRITNPGKPRVPVLSDGRIIPPEEFCAEFLESTNSDGNTARKSPGPRPRSRSTDHRNIGILDQRNVGTLDHDRGVGAIRAQASAGDSIDSEPDPWDPDPEPETQPKPKRGPGRPRKDRPSVEGWQRVVDAYWLAFEAANGCKPNPSPRTLGELRTRIMQAGADEVIRRIGILFTDPPAWPQGPHDLTNLVGQHFDRFATPGSKASRSKQANRGSVIDAAPTDPVKYYEPNDWQKSLGPEWQPKDPETERREIDAWYAERDARDAAAKLPVEVPKTVMPDGSIRVGFTR